MPRSPSPFLTAAWRSLAMFNYEIDPAVLAPYVPAGTELDLYEGKAFASMVGFLFLDTRLYGIPVPFHRNFEEVNLRFYVRRTLGQEVRRGVVFISELVPKPAIAWLARALYNEQYRALPMGNAVGENRVSYWWRFRGKQNRMEAAMRGEPKEIGPGSHEEFITEHYWGYARQRNGKTMEYRVDHPRWRFWDAVDPLFDCDVGALYGQKFVPFLKTPFSAFIAEGSKARIFKGTLI